METVLFSDSAGSGDVRLFLKRVLVVFVSIIADWVEIETLSFKKFIFMGWWVVWFLFNHS